jgi:multidrug efflux pump subunit AcrA (membrane-fusion protein)
MLTVHRGIAMPALATPLPCRRDELVFRPLGEHGPYVVKDPRTGAYYHLGEEEHFLLTHLDGTRDSETIRTAFVERFGQPLDDADLHDFLDMAREQGFLRSEEPAGSRAVPQQPRDEDAAPLGLRILFWRKSLFDPDRFFTWLAPKIGFFWTRAFLVFSAASIALATLLVWTNQQALARSLQSALRWETALLIWLVLVAVTTCHEFAHGLTCKRYGGEVHEIGFLLIFFMPCFFCNVSDAWLFKEKSKRLWVTLAGGYFELFLWALAVFVWRLTTPDNLINYLSFIVLSACGVKTLFNFNPLLKLDGYYLLSDWLEIPNLQKRSADHVKSRIRWLLWGAARPGPEPRGRVLLFYGLVSWLFSLLFLGISLTLLGHFLGTRLGLPGLALVALLALVSLRGLFHGFTAGEVRNMFLFRRLRTLIWVLFLVGVPTALFIIPMEDRASGSFQVRPAVRAELRAPVAGFLREVCGDEGDRVAEGTLVARLEIPDLASRIAQKRSEVREVEARVRLLEAGPRYEEVTEQRRRVERAESWRDLARQDLGRARLVLAEDLKRLEEQCAQCQIELATAQDSLARASKVQARGGTSAEELADADRKCKVCKAQAEQAHALKKSRQTLGTQEAESELARRDKELADARAALTLLEAGTRPEEIEAEKARRARLQEEVRSLENVQTRLTVFSPAAGFITTPRLKEKVGQYLREGDLIGVVEDTSRLEIEITLAEQDVARIEVGQAVQLKARSLPFDTFPTRVKRIATTATHGDAQSTLLLACELENDAFGLRPGMTGHARVFTGQQSVGMVFCNRALRYVRTEFWW